MDDKDFVELKRLISNMVFYGRVTATDFKTDPGMVRVKIGAEEEKDDEYYIPWLRRRCGNDWEWWAPEVDEMVLIISPDGNLDRAVIIGAIPYPKKPEFLAAAEKGKRWVLEEGEKEPPDDEKNKKEATAHFVQYEDKTFTSYDKKLHLFEASFLEGKTINFKIDAKKDEEKVDIKVKEVEAKLDGTKDKENVDVKIKDVEVKIDAAKDAENVDVKVKDVKARIDGASGKEKVTINVKDASKLEMDGKGNIKITGKGTKMILKDDGSVTVECKKAAIKASGEVEVKGSMIKLNC